MNVRVCQLDFCEFDTRYKSLGKKKELNWLVGKSMREHHVKFMSLGMSQGCIYVFICRHSHGEQASKQFYSMESALVFASRVLC